ncbi:MAG: glycosyltransferase family 4 protein, partial [Burkholderiales bacterium]
MHIAFLSPTWPPGVFPNGIVTYVDWMRRGLMARGHRVSVFTGVAEPATGDPTVHVIGRSVPGQVVDAVKLRLLRRRRSVFDAGDVIADSMRKVHRVDPIDVIEMEESFGWAAEVARQTGIPMVVKLHGPAFLHLVEEDLATPHGQEKVRREGLALARLPIIIAPARFTLDKTLARYGLEPKIGQQVVNPVALAEGVPLWRLDGCERDTVLFVGRFDKVKGGDLVLRAFQRLLARKPHLKLVFVGPDSGLVRPDGSKIQFEAFMKSLGDAALTRAVSYRGRLAPSEVASLRARSMVTVVASRHENQAYTVLEAMLQGC